MKRVKAVLSLELALLAFWPPFWWALLAPRRLFYQTPAFFQSICQAAPYMMMLDVVPGLLGLWMLSRVRREQGKRGAFRLASFLCILHTAAGGVLLGMCLIVAVTIIFFRIVH